MVELQQGALELSGVRLLHGSIAVEGHLLPLPQPVHRLRQHLGLRPQLQPQRRRRPPQDAGELPQGGDHLLRLLLLQVQGYSPAYSALRECRRKLDFYRLPSVLVLQIKRFSFGKFSKQKLTNRIRVSEALDLSRLIALPHHPSTKNPIY